MTIKSSLSNETFTFVENCNCYASRSSDFVNHSYDYRPNWTPLSPITIIYY